MTQPNEPINMDVTPNGSMSGTYGLTKREYFAAIMLQGLVTLSSHQQSHESHAMQAIVYADALIKALNKTPTP